MVIQVRKGKRKHGEHIILDPAGEPMTTSANFQKLEKLAATNLYTFWEGEAGTNLHGKIRWYQTTINEIKRELEGE